MIQSNLINGTTATRLSRNLDLRSLVPLQKTRLIRFVKCAVKGSAMLLSWTVDIEGFAMSVVWKCGSLSDIVICSDGVFRRCFRLRKFEVNWLRSTRLLGLFIVIKTILK